MDPTPQVAPYSAFADWLSKFHTSSEPIQALWIVAIAVVALGIVWLAIRGITDILARRARPAGRLVLGVYQDHCGRYMLYRDGRDVAEVDWGEPTLPSMRDGNVTRAFGAPGGRWPGA